MNIDIKEVVLTEVGTRDGFQSEKKIVSTEDKICLLMSLLRLVLNE